MLSIKTRVSRKPRKANPVKNTFSDRYYTLDMNVLLVTCSQIKLQKEEKNITLGTHECTPSNPESNRTAKGNKNITRVTQRGYVTGTGT